MEISKIINKINSLSEQTKTAYKKDIEKSIEILLQDYDIYKKGTNEIITKNELINTFIKLNCDSIYCCAATKTGTKCKNKVIDNSNYCGKHYYSGENLKQILHPKIHFSNNSNYEIIDNLNNEMKNTNDLYTIEINNNTIDKSQLKNILIEDSFYLVDNEWIYDKQSYEKVGYLEKNNNTINYILSSDPFILNIN
jgi:hypothetical protein